MTKHQIIHSTYATKLHDLSQSSLAQCTLTMNIINIYLVDSIVDVKICCIIDGRLLVCRQRNALPDGICFMILHQSTTKSFISLCIHVTMQKQRKPLYYLHSYGTSLYSTAKSCNEDFHQLFTALPLYFWWTI